MSQPVYAFPLSYAQQRLWFLDQLAPGGSFYNIPVAIPIDTPIDGAVLQQCVDTIVARHETLRTTFELVDGQPRQRVHDRVCVEVRRLDVTETPAAARDARVQEVATTEARTPFDLREGPLLRATLVRVEAQRHVLLLTLHHIIADAWSIGVLWSEVTALYVAFAAGRASPLPPLPIQYADYALWQRQWLTGDVRAQHVGYWRERLQGLSTLALPTDRPRPTIQSFSGDHVAVHLDAALTRALGRLSHQAGATLFMTVLAGFQALLMRYAGQTDVMVGTPIAGRDRAQLEGLIGFFVNTLVLRTDLSGDPTVLALIARTRETALGAYAHAALPFEMLVEELHPQRDLSRNPLFQVTFQLFAASRTPGSGTPAPPMEIRRGTAPFDLSLSLWENADGLRGVLEYSTDLYERATIARLAGHLQTLLAGMVAQPHARLSQLPLLTAGERRQLLVDWNATAAAYSARCLHEVIQTHAQRDPHAVAVVFGDDVLTYGALEHQANQVAHRLRACGVRAETLVGLCVERSLRMVVGVLGILKAGGAYVPLDPQYPPERLRYMLEDAQVTVLVTEEALAPRLPQRQATHVLRLDREWPAIAALPGDAPPPADATPDTLAYVIYTSGSTGAPKGVMVPHRAIGNHMEWMLREFPWTTGDRVLQRTALSFDASVWEIFAPLMAGATMVVCPPDRLQSVIDLPAIIKAHSVTILQVVPSILGVLLDSPLFAACTSLRRVFCGGEALSAELVRRFHRMLGIDLINLYGPTEAAVDATFARFAARDSGDGWTVASIGRPIANAQAYVLDEARQPVPCGVPGELYIGGAGLARGYLGRPELTAERFVPHPFSDAPGARVYRTGDRVRHRPDGQLEFLGRIDQQIKLRGFRIDLGEVEAVLTLHPAVAQAVAMLREDASGHPQLVAYVLPQRGLTISTPELQRFVRERVPDYMAPAAWVVLAQWPITPNGKVDRDALPPAGTQIEAAYVAPSTSLERVLAQLWSGVLNVERIGVHDNFFELGGHSLLAVKLVSRVREALFTELPLRVLFEVPTVSGMSERLRASASTMDIDKVAEMHLMVEALDEGAVEAMLRERFS